MMDEMTAAEYNTVAKMSPEQQAKWLLERMRKDVELERDVISQKIAKAVYAKPKGMGERPKVLDELEEFLDHGNYGRVWKEHQFHPTRKWRADFYLPDQSPEVIIEYDGIMSGAPSHSSIRGIARDAEKGNEAQALGYRFYRFNAVSLGDGSAYEFLVRVLMEHPEGR